MKLAVLPFNVSEGIKPGIGRQFSNFASDLVRLSTGTENLHPVSFLAQVEDAEGPRAAYVNVSDTLLEPDWIRQLFEQSDVDRAMDGLLSSTGEGSYSLRLRFHERGNDEPLFDESFEFELPGLFAVLDRLVRELAKHADAPLPAEMESGGVDFGTDNPESFLQFFEGYDAVQYIQQTNGRVAKEFSPAPAIEALLKAYELDPEFLGPYESLVQLGRLCAQFRLGDFNVIHDALVKLTESTPDDYRAHFALGELFQAVNNASKAAEWYEKAVQIEPSEPALLTRLGVSQMLMGMPVNAERNFRKAIELEGEEKPSLDYLATVLQQTGREHEIAGMWKEQVQRQPQNAQAHAKYAIALIQTQQEAEGERAFEEALELLEDTALIKRYYAPYLAQKGELDRAMDYFEDCLDLAPADAQLLLEYANTLKLADREFEIPKVLRDVLATNPDPNTRAQTLAWLIELEQPRRAEMVNQAREKLEQRDPDAAVGLLRPLRNWLADYWKMWAMLSAANNELGNFPEAEEAAKRVIDLFPGCEPAYGELLKALSALKKHDEAYNMMRYGTVNLPQSLTAHVNLALAAHRSGRRDEAVGLSRQIREAVGPNEELEAILAEIPS